ncbi:MAG: DUF493 family protein [Candidatus Omnitrophica bacterium]|nr:DUF493 family protein [Candidatus Omnitrophota bacterium]
MERPQIEYPCEWGYKIIGAEDAALKAAAQEILGEKDYEISFSNISRNGNYIALEVTTRVIDEPERNRIYLSFHSHPAVLRVI